MVIYSATSQKKTGRVSAIASKIRNEIQANEAAVPVVAVRPKRKRTAVSGGSAKRSVAGALTTLSGPVTGQLGLGLVPGTAAVKAQAEAPAVHLPPVPLPRPLRKATATATAAASGLTAKVPGAATAVSAVHEAIPIAGSGSVSTTETGLAYPPAIKKSSLSTRKVGGGKATDSSSVKRRVKFSVNVHTYPSTTSTKKSARIGELQLKKRTKKLKRSRTRREGGGPLAAIANDLASISQENPKPVSIGGIEDPLKAPRILRLNVVGKPAKVTGKSALADALRRKANRLSQPKSVVAENTSKSGGPIKSVKFKAKSAKKSGGSASSTIQLGERPKAAGVAPRKKAGLGKKATTSSIATTPLVPHERQSHGKARS
ncbi:uncharacterized protein [Drosophila bipectinata]|uniref:uncharacterized protein n=1 Tax=Drosophila bipectinata TaxID=42026 RepID=UPI001C8AA60B|nr:uncharacterized protein LOC108120283 [Drosophila bipectinata]